MDRFTTLLSDLGALINVPLHPDAKRLCKMSINGHLHVQIQEEEYFDRLIVSTFVSEIPAGKFREIVLKRCLEENNLYPRLGTFAYSDRNNSLAFYARVYYPGLQGDNFADFLGTFFEKALQWKQGIETGQLPSLEKMSQKMEPTLFNSQ